MEIENRPDEIHSSRGGGIRVSYVLINWTLDGGCRGDFPAISSSYRLLVVSSDGVIDDGKKRFDVYDGSVNETTTTTA